MQKKVLNISKIGRFFACCISVFLLTSCDIALLNPKGAVGVAQKEIILIALGLMLIVVIPVVVMAIWFPIYFRASNKKALYTPQWCHSNIIEYSVWGVPLIIITILGAITWQTTHQLDPAQPISSERKKLIIEVISFDWNWLFIYPEYNIGSINELAIPVDIPVEFKLTSYSVMNSFFIPKLGSQIYAMAGMETKLNLIANEAGKYKGVSASYSGHGFSDMKFDAIVTANENDFYNWINRAKTSSLKLTKFANFEQLVKPNSNMSVIYFSDVLPHLFNQVIAQFHHPQKNNMLTQH